MTPVCVLLIYLPALQACEQLHMSLRFAWKLPIPECTTSLLRELVEVPIALSVSRTMTSRPDNARALPIARPTTPEHIHVCVRQKGDGQLA